VRGRRMGRRGQPIRADVLLRHPVPLRAPRLRRAGGAVQRLRRAVPGPGVPGAHRVVRLRERGGHPGGPRLARPHPTPRGAGRRGPRGRRGRRGAAYLLPRHRPPAGTLRAARGVLPGGRAPRETLGRDGVRRGAGARGHRADQLGPRRGGLRGRRVLGLVEGTSAGDRRDAGARHRREALPALPAGGLPRGRSAPWTAPGPRPSGGRRCGGLVGSQRAGAALRARGLEGVLGVQRGPRAGPGLPLARRLARGSPCVRGDGEHGLVGGVPRRLRCRARARSPRRDTAAHPPARAAGPRRVPRREQGVLAAVRPLAAAGRGPGPAAVARPARVAGR
jgi:hypothetical protein